MATTELALEGGHCSFGVLARVRFDAYVGVRGLPIDSGRKRPIVLTGNQDVKEGDRFFFFFLPGELYSLVNGVETGLEVSCWILRFSGGGGGAAAETSAARGVVY